MKLAHRTLLKTDPVLRNKWQCPVCHCQFQPHDIVVFCPADNVAHHATCWLQIGNHCISVGCPGTGEVGPLPDQTPKAFGVFISHASEDKDEVARPLAQELERLGVKVWLDEHELTLGDSLRQEIDRGLKQSRFGVVILSPNFFAKEWPQRELDALVAIEGLGKVILPVWHQLTKEQMIRYSPLLAGKLSVSTSKGIHQVAQEIVRAIKREEGENSDPEPPEDTRAQELADMRKRLLLATTIPALVHLRHEIDSFLTSYPTDVEGKILRDHIEKAYLREVRPLQPVSEWLPSTREMYPRRYSTIPIQFIALIIVLGALIVGIAMYFLQNWK